jgi:hypothetical protein
MDMLTQRSNPRGLGKFSERRLSERLGLRVVLPISAASGIGGQERDLMDQWIAMIVPGCEFFVRQQPVGPSQRRLGAYNWGRYARCGSVHY